MPLLPSHESYCLRNTAHPSCLLSNQRCPVRFFLSSSDSDRPNPTIIWIHLLASTLHIFPINVQPINARHMTGQAIHPRTTRRHL